MEGLKRKSIRRQTDVLASVAAGEEVPDGLFIPIAPEAVAG